ncbi:MAG TPA: type II toxin-antitoxin system VapC family toxin [Pirellulales bacterium]|nr:type II toxin-antitoxin system VapC family toxin [Pirellulales bacterium]
MIHLLDTDMLIFMIRGLKPGRRAAQRQRADELVERCRRAQAENDSVGLSAITVSELEFGARNSDRYEVEITAVHKVLSPFTIYDYDSVSCPRHYGRIRNELETQGVAIGSMDLLIAAHALALSATIVSNNLAHFSRVAGLQTANWLTRPSVG